MSAAGGESLEPYRASIVPALLRIQREQGYLTRKALEDYAETARVPLHRLQSVASFFPHFQLAPPSLVTLRVCRDMSCHLAGSEEALQIAAGEGVEVTGVSCLGRCDRAPAACLSVAGQAHEQYYLGRSAEQLREVVRAAAAGDPMPPDRDVDHVGLGPESKIDIYADGAPRYQAVRRALAARDASLDRATEILSETGEWPSRQLEQFRRAALRQNRGEPALPASVTGAVRDWQTENGWAKGPELGGWAESFVEEFRAADLRGLGGAGIPVIQKWNDVRDAVRNLRRRGEDDRAFIVVNGDESEPGTFKDREILLRAPHLVVEAVILAGLMTEATQGFIFIRHEYEEQIEACREEIARAEQMGFCGKDASELGHPFPVAVFVSPGGYICGEQSALIEAMSDRRGEPRNMPPKLETNGLADQPTLVSNVETFAWAPFICVKGGAAYAAEGVNGWKGRRLFSVSGDVERPGVYEVPMGLTLRELIHDESYCRGIAKGGIFKALAPSGPSGGFLPARLSAPEGLPREHTKNAAWQALAARRGFDVMASELDLLDLELELALFRQLSPTAALGAGIVVYAEPRDMLLEAVKSLEFFRNESCGKCVPCRSGSQKFASLGSHILAGRVEAERWRDELAPLVREMSRAIELASICGLGRSVPMPLLTVMRFFPDDLTRHLQPGESRP